MFLEHYLELIIPPVAAAIEFIGLIVIVFGCVVAVSRLVLAKFDFNNLETKLVLASAISLALEFKLAAEVLLTVTIKSINEFYIIAAVAILRIIISFVLHWEMKELEESKVRTLKREASLFNFLKPKSDEDKVF